MKQEKESCKNQGFTLIEMLVVVLIIGILAGIALPQYNRTVERTKLSEALMNFKVLEGAVERYLLVNDLPNDNIYLKDIPLDIELSGGEFDEEGISYFTKDFEYQLICDVLSCAIYAYRRPYDYELYLEIKPSWKSNPKCAATYTEKGKDICKYLETQGWQYSDGEI